MESSLVTRRNNLHPHKLDTMSSTLTTELTSDSDLEVVDVNLISGDTLVAYKEVHSPTLNVHSCLFLPEACLYPGTCLDDLLFDTLWCNVDGLIPNFFLHLLQNVPGDTPKEQEKPSKAISPGTFFGISKVLKPRMTSVQATRIKAVAQLVETPKKQIVTPFQAMPKRQEWPRPLLQPKFDVSVASKPDFNTRAGRFIPS